MTHFKFVASLLVLLFASVMMLSLFNGCRGAMGNARTYEQLSPKEKASWMMGIYNSQYADYQSMTGYVWDAEAVKWKKVNVPILNADQKEILAKKKEMLTKVYPLIQFYNAAVHTNSTPDRKTEQEIINLLNGLQGM